MRKLSFSSFFKQFSKLIFDSSILMIINTIMNLLCIHVKELTKYPKSTDQISGGIWSVNETGFTGFEVDQCKHSFGHNSLGLQRIVTKFGQVNLLVKNVHMQISLLR